MVKQSSLFGKWLYHKYLEWQYQSGERKTLAQFAQWIGISGSLIGHWVRGTRNPSRRSVELLALRLGPAVYDVLNVDPLDPDLLVIMENWGKLKASDRKQVFNFFREQL